MGCRASFPIVPEDPQEVFVEDIIKEPEQDMIEYNNKEYINIKYELYHNKEYQNDSVFYEEPVLDSFTESDIKYQNSKSLEERQLTDNNENIIKKAERIIKDYKKIVKFILKNEKIDIYIFNFEKKLVSEWLSISQFMLMETKYLNEFNKYNMKYNLLLNHFNDLYKIVEKDSSTESSGNMTVKITV
jgi:2,3-bisphosphoglycerate-independent phosphoglycerate mutase